MPAYRFSASGGADQTKVLLRILISDLRVKSRGEILPTYRVGAPVVCAQTSSVEPTEVNANRFARVAGGQMALAEAGGFPSVQTTLFDLMFLVVGDSLVFAA